MPGAAVRHGGETVSIDGDRASLRGVDSRTHVHPFPEIDARFCAMIMALALGLRSRPRRCGRAERQQAEGRPTPEGGEDVQRPSLTPTRSARRAPWPVATPRLRSPAPFSPAKRIVAFYGNPLSKRMGILGELDSAKMLAKLDTEVAAWNKVDPDHPVQPALHLIAVVAADQPDRQGSTARAWTARSFAASTTGRR